jgi:release factor glutamine methyltransferase
MFAIGLSYRHGAVADMTVALPVEALLRVAVRRLRGTGQTSPAEAVLDTRVLLACVLQVPRSRLDAHPEAPVAEADAQRFTELIEQRARGEPVAYLTGHREFWSLDLRVTPDVLVPRPETELVVERALALGSAGAARVADLGTGSGAIALAIAHERPGWQVVATDVSAAAVALARDNARTLNLPSVEFRVGDWFAPLAAENFDLILSNPPYVAAGDPALLKLEHEPRLALTPGDDALHCLRILAQGAPAHLRAGGWLVLEHGAEQAQEVRRALVAAGFGHVRSHRDLSAHERVTEGQR